jgi:polyketide synthase 3/4
VSLRDLAYTLACRRSHRPVRTAVTARTTDELVAALREVAEGELPYPAAVGRGDRGPVWVFSGQGSQWARMGADLLASEPVFAATIAEIEPIIARESGFSVTEAMSAPEKVTGIDRVQPTIFAMQVAMAETLKSYGVRPGAVIGHSLGESAAAVVAGALSLEDGLKVICRRSKLMKRISGSGAMAAVELPGPQVLSELSVRGIKNVVLAVAASPTSTVIGGDKDAVRELVEHWESNGVMAREVAVDVASHTAQVEPILDDLVEALADLQPRDPEVPYYSSTLWDPRDRPSFAADYWSENLRYTVRFASAVQAALNDGFRVFGELAPHPLLTHAVDQNAASLDMPIAALASMRREQDLPVGLRGFVSDLHSAGAAVDFATLYPSGELVDAPLPTWTHRELMLNRDEQDTPGHGSAVVAVHPLLGAHVHLAEEPPRDVWQGEVGTEAHPWLADHMIHNIAALPGAAYCEMALAAAGAVLGAGAEVRDIRFEQTLLLDEQTAISAAATLQAPGVLTFAVTTQDEGQSTGRAAATLRAPESDAGEPPAAPTHDIEALVASHPVRADGADLRQAFDSVGIQYGPAFSGLTATYTAEGQVDTVFAEVALPSAIRSQQSVYGVHPALLDACFQSVVVHPTVQNAGSGGLLLPVGVRRLRLHQPARNAHYCLTRVRETRAGECEADIEIMDQVGTVLLTVEGLRMSAGVSEAEQANRTLNERLLTIEWEPRELPDTRQDGRWLVFSTADAAEPLARQITDAVNSAAAESGSSAAARWEQFTDAAQISTALAATTVAEPFTGLVLVLPPAVGPADSATSGRGREHVALLVKAARELAELPEPPRLFVVTRDAATVSADELANLEQAGIRGLMRVIDSEHPHLKATGIDLDGSTDPALVARQLLTGSDEDETAWRNGDWYTARLLRGPLRPGDRRTTQADAASDRIRLEVRMPGDVESLEFVRVERVQPGPGEIEVAVTASSINFADVLVAFGRYPTFEGYKQQLGIDFAGVVTAVGPGVTEHKVGDHVGGMSPNGCWSTFVISDARHAVTVPAGIPLADAAAIPTASATAWYGLHELAHITAADKVLIHSGTGGVGQSAIAIARAVGCEIFATAGSEARRQVLRDMGIEHVYDSRSLDFADEIRRDTGGYGVDVVLNSLPGAAQRAGIELLAFGGRFLEIGKRDIYGDTRIGLFPFRRNLSFYAIDVALLTHSHPAIVQRMLTTVYQQTADGVLPMPPTTHFPMSEAAQAVRLVGGAGHTGKVLLDVAHHGEVPAVVAPSDVPVFRADGSYIVTGGLGGLGLFLAGEMASAGCGRIVLNSRSAPNAEAQEALEKLRAGGADVQVVSGDISDPTVAESLVAVATETGLPVRGVLHGAAVVEDATLTNITDTLLDHCWEPKVAGAWSLHEATLGQPLDWFCSFSSAAALVGSPGQGAYSAANSWLDAFSRWRHAQGLPATAIAWGAWSQVGRGMALAEGTGIAIEPAEGAQAFETLLRYSRPYSGYAPIIGTPWLQAFGKRSKFAEAFQSASTAQGDSGKFLSELRAVSTDEWPGMIRKLVSEQLSLLLRRTIDPDRPLSDYGLDSLGNLELRTRIETETGVRIGPTQITTVRGLADHLCEELQQREAVPAPAG